MRVTNLESASDADFLAGRDLAVRMLRHMQDVGDSDASSIEAQYRQGETQVNAAMPYLAQLLARPQLLEGFAAVLSDGFHVGTFADADVYARLTIGEMRGPKHDGSFQRFLSDLSGSAR